MFRPMLHFRYLKTQGRTDVLSSPEFKLAKKAVKRKTKELVRMGKGRKPHCATELTAQDEEALWMCGELGTHNAHSLFNTIWLILQELLVLKKAKFNSTERCLWGDVSLGMDVSGREYLELHGRETKNITGEVFGVEEIRPKAWANLNNPARCPVEIFKIFTQRRHPSSLLSISPFFVAASKRRGEEYWYMNKNVGRNTLGSMLGEMARRANLPGKKCISSLQKTDRRIPFFSTFHD